MVKYVFSWMLLFLFIRIAPGLTQKSDATLILSEIITEAIKQNPQLRSAENAWLAEQAKIPQAGSLPDPTLSFNLLNMPVNTFDFNQEAMTGKQLAFMQMFPFPGKLGLRESIATERALASEARFEETQNQLIKSIKITYYQLFFVDKAIEITEKNIGLLKEFVRIAETKYSVGRGLQQDVLKAQVELSKMMERTINLRQQREALEAHLNALLNRAPESPVGKPPEPAIPPLKYDLSQLKNLADENRPLLKIWQAMIRKSEQAVRLAKKDFLPDFRIGVAYTQREILQNGGKGIDFLSGIFTINVPLYFWRKQSKKVEEKRFTHRTIRDSYENVRNQVYSGLEKTLTDVERNRKLIDLFKTGIIPQATQSLNSAIAGYQTDKVDFLTLLNNQITLFNYELDYYRVLSNYNKGMAELEALVGVNLVNKE